MTCAREERLQREAHAAGRRECLASAKRLGLNLLCADHNAGECLDRESCPFFLEALAEAQAVDSLLSI